MGKLKLPKLGEKIGRERRDRAIVALAKETQERGGELEIDDGALVSEGDDDGAWVQAWVWVDFEGTKLDKEGANA